jgi:hypothetical protein
VETIGDCYLAVSGLPESREDHAVVMAKFAMDCREKFNELCSTLETTLGPETSDLRLRVGLNSGPVTAGVLRGQRARFQLFGDTVNTAARMESTGVKNKIQISQSTADQLKKFKKLHWLHPREEMVEAKGKGLMVTYFVEPRRTARTISNDGSVRSSIIAVNPSSSAFSTTSTATTSNSSAATELVPSIKRLKSSTSSKSDSTASKTIFRFGSSINSRQRDRLINWNVDVLERLLRKIVARRIVLLSSVTSNKKMGRGSFRSGSFRSINEAADWIHPKDTKILKEFQEVIRLPDFDSNSVHITEEDLSTTTHLDLAVRQQLRDFVTAIANTYNDDKNPFHSFQHASHGKAYSLFTLLFSLEVQNQTYDLVIVSSLH